MNGSAILTLGIDDVALPPLCFTVGEQRCRKVSKTFTRQFRRERDKFPYMRLICQMALATNQRPIETKARFVSDGVCNAWFKFFAIFTPSIVAENSAVSRIEAINKPPQYCLQCGRGRYAAEHKWLSLNGDLLYKASRGLTD